MFSKLNFAIYEEIENLNPEFRKKYHTPDVTYSALAKIMKTLLVKRLDSSFSAFKSTFLKFVEKTRSKIKQFENNRIYIIDIGDVHIAEYILEDREDELIERINKEESIGDIYKANDFNKNFIEKLNHDIDLMLPILNRWNLIDEDPKYDLFVKYLTTILFDPVINIGNKIVVF